MFERKVYSNKYGSYRYRDGCKYWRVDENPKKIEN